MLVLPASGYPTELVPTVEPQGTPNAFQRIQATPEAFGAQIGAGESALGRTAEQAGNEFAQAAIAKQEVLNQTNADAASNDWLQNHASVIQYGDPNDPNDRGFFGKN